MPHEGSVDTPDFSLWKSAPNFIFMLLMDYEWHVIILPLKTVLIFKRKGSVMELAIEMW